LFLGEEVEGFPEPADDLVFLLVFSLVVGVESPVLDIDVGHSVEQHLHLVGQEDFEQLLWDDFVEALAQVVDGAYDLFLADGLDAE
jgi:hypothetical protein